MLFILQLLQLFSVCLVASAASGEQITAVRCMFSTMLSYEVVLSTGSNKASFQSFTAHASQGVPAVLLPLPESAWWSSEQGAEKVKQHRHRERETKKQQLSTSHMQGLWKTDYVRQSEVKDQHVMATEFGYHCRRSWSSAVIKPGVRVSWLSWLQQAHQGMSLQVLIYSLTYFRPVAGFRASWHARYHHELRLNKRRLEQGRFNMIASCIASWELWSQVDKMAIWSGFKGPEISVLQNRVYFFLKLSKNWKTEQNSILSLELTYYFPKHVWRSFSFSLGGIC